MDADLTSIQNARSLVTAAHAAQQQFKTADQATVDRIVKAMVDAGAGQAEPLARHACEETGFGRVDSKTAKNLFATQTLHERMDGMKTAGIVRKGESIWEVAHPMGVVAALVPSTNPTSTAMYKAILSVKARCGIVMSPHPRAAECSAAALRVVADAAYKAGAPQGLLGCLSPVTIAGTNALLDHDLTSVILATGGSAMVKAAYQKGKPAYGVGSGNVPVFVDRSADVEAAAEHILTGTSFDWGTLCSTERSVVGDAPISRKLLAAMAERGGHVCSPDEIEKLRRFVYSNGRFNADQVGKSPAWIAREAGFRVPDSARALIAEVDEVGKGEPLSMETLSPILSFYHADGWQAGCDRCVQILHFGGIGHTLGLHCTSETVAEQFALQKPAMRIVVNTTTALGSVGYTTDLFPAMTLGPGTVGGSITSDNLSPLHLIHIKRVAWGVREAPKADPSAPRRSARRSAPQPTRSAPASSPRATAMPTSEGSWIEKIEARLLARSGNPVRDDNPSAHKRTLHEPAKSQVTAQSAAAPAPTSPDLPLSESRVDALIARYRK